MRVPNAARARHNPATFACSASAPRQRGFQIGPKIRIGGTVGKIGQSIKTGLGQVEKAVAKPISLIPGIGPILGTGLAAHGSVLDTTHGSVGPGQIIGNAAQAGGIGALGKIAGMIPGVSSVGNVLGGIKGAIEGIPGVSQIESGLGGLLGGVVDKVKSDPMGVLGGVNSAIDAAHARDLQGKAEGLALDNYNQRAPLRAAGVAGLLKPAVPDLSGINYGSSGSVYGKKRAAQGGY